MKKNITNLLQKGNLTPKERYLLCVHNEVIKHKTGKAPLTEADEKALESWHAKTNDEAREWNKYNNAWKLSGRAELEAHLVYEFTRTEHFRENLFNMELNFYPFYREAKQHINQLEKMKRVDINGALEIAKKQREQKLKDGKDFEGAVYSLAFEKLSGSDKQKFIKLYPDIEFDTQWLDDEEIITGLFKGKDKLTDQETKEAKEKLAELVAGQAYNKFSKEYQLSHYFACIPILEVAGRWAKAKGIKPTKKYTELEEKAIKGVAKEDKISEDEAKEKLFLENELNEILKNYARDNQTTIEAILKETCLKWLDEENGKDLIEQYTPLFFSKTGLPLLELWIKTKAQARAALQGHIEKGELKTDQDGKIITGESLYNFKHDYKFVKEFKEYADRYDPNLGIVKDPEHEGEFLDRDLVITHTGGIGAFDFKIRGLKGIIEYTHFIKETKKDGEIVIEFTDDKFKNSYREIRDTLTANYASLLAYKEIQEKVSKVFDIDLAEDIKSFLEKVGSFIDQHNEALNMARTGGIYKDGEGYTERGEAGEAFIKRGITLKIDEDLFINKDKIQTDIDTLERWNKQFYEVLGEEYKF